MTRKGIHLSSRLPPGRTDETENRWFAGNCHIDPAFFTPGLEKWIEMIQSWRKESGVIAASNRRCCRDYAGIQPDSGKQELFAGWECAWTSVVEFQSRADRTVADAAIEIKGLHLGA